MNTRTQTSLIVVSTLILGIVIGGLGTGVLQEKRVKQNFRMPPDQRFYEAMDRII